MASPSNERPDLVGTVLELPPGMWWSDDGWLRMEIDHVGPLTNDRPLPDGWVWVIGTLRADGLPVDTCSVPVRADALPRNGAEVAGAGAAASRTVTAPASTVRVVSSRAVAVE